MRKVLYVIVLCYASNILAQKSFYSQDSTLQVKNVYLGIYSGTFFDTQKLSVSNAYSARAGAAASYQLSNRLSAQGLAVYEKNQSGNKFISSFGLDYKISNRLNVKIGNIPTPATLLRPLPPSQSGQFESWTTSQLPGSSLGIMLDVSFPKKKDPQRKGFVGVYKKGDFAEFHIGAQLYDFRFAAFMANGNGNRVGWTFQYIHRKFEMTAFYEMYQGKRTGGNLFVYKLKKDLFLYSDFGYELEFKQLERLEIGILKNIKVDFIPKLPLGGYVGAGYNHKVKSLVGYLQINL